MTETSNDTYSDFERLWIAACAVYPVLRWPLTVKLGRELADETNETRPDLDAHVPLARHPWFRDGVIPDEARRSLLDSLSSKQRAVVRRVYRNVLGSPDLELEGYKPFVSGKDDPIYTRFLQGEDPSPTETRADRWIWRQLPLARDLIDLRTGVLAGAALALAVSGGFLVENLTQHWNEAGSDLSNAVPLPEMIALPGGEFEMGSEKGDEDEKPTRMVTVAPFAIAKFEVTGQQYKAFLDATGYRPGQDETCFIWNIETRESEGVTANPDTGIFDLRVPAEYGTTVVHPAVCVSWDDAQAFLGWLNEVRGLTGQPDQFRLPTEAEWEYAARAGSLGEYYWSEVASNALAAACGYANLRDQAAQVTEEFGEGWTYANCDDGVPMMAPVGGYLPNAFGLHDMSGNVWEWVADCWHGNYVKAPLTSLPAWEEADGGDCSRRVVRGGSWLSDPRLLRSAIRGRYEPDVRISNIGFRPARTLFTP